MSRHIIKCENVEKRCFVDKEKKQDGFTLIELLVVISIIALLLSILMPSLNKARTAARRVICMTNQKQIALASVAYSAANKGITPAVRNNWNAAPNMPVDQRQVYGWFVRWQDLELWLGPGLLYKQKYVGEGKVLYCPFVKTSEPMGYDYEWKKVLGNYPSIVYSNYIMTFERKAERARGQFAMTVDFCAYGNPIFDTPQYPDVQNGLSHYKLARGGRVGELVIGYSDGSAKGVEDVDAIFAGTRGKPFAGSSDWQHPWRCYAPSLVMTRILFYGFLDPSYNTGRFEYRRVSPAILTKPDLPD